MNFIDGGLSAIAQAPVNLKHIGQLKIVVFNIPGRNVGKRKVQRASRTTFRTTMKIGMKRSRPPADSSWTDFVCQDCGKSYNRQVNLQRHQRVECGNKEKTFHCKFCPKMYYHRFELKGHLHQGHKIPEHILPQILMQIENEYRIKRETAWVNCESQNLALQLYERLL